MSSELIKTEPCLMTKRKLEAVPDWRVVKKLVSCVEMLLEQLMILCNIPIMLLPGVSSLFQDF